MQTTCTQVWGKSSYLVAAFSSASQTRFHQSIISLIVIQLDVNGQWADHIELLLAPFQFEKHRNFGPQIVKPGMRPKTTL